jgi:cytochrome o ubiquinol oxidase subunit 2
MKLKIGLLCAFLLLLAAATALYIRAVPIPLFETAGPIAAAERNVIIFTFALSSIVIFPVFGLLFYFAWKYRDTHPEVHVHHRPDWDHDNRVVEFSWWLIPAVIIGILGVVAWKTSHSLDPFVPIENGNAPLEIEAVALQWKWLFLYKDEGIATVNELVIPEGRPVHFSLTGDAPINTFWVPALAGQIMVMQGMSSQLSMLADKEGVFDGLSGNLSGKGFADMKFTVRSVSEPAYEAWLSTTKQSSPLTAQGFTSLETPNVVQSPQQYSSYDSGLYTSIIAKYARPPAAVMSGK